MVFTLRRQRYIWDVDLLVREGHLRHNHAVLCGDKCCSSSERNFKVCWRLTAQRWCASRDTLSKFDRSLQYTIPTAIMRRPFLSLNRNFHLLRPHKVRQHRRKSNSPPFRSFSFRTMAVRLVPIAVCKIPARFLNASVVYYLFPKIEPETPESRQASVYYSMPRIRPITGASQWIVPVEMICVSSDVFLMVMQWLASD